LTRDPQILAKKLDFPRAHRKTREDIAYWIIDHPEYFPDLLDFCFKTELKISHKAAWVLEIVCEEQMDLLLPHLDGFFENIPKVKKDQAVRPLAKICLMLAKKYYKKKDQKVVKTLTNKHKEIMTECCFDWLITDQKVACEAYSMYVLYLLGSEIDWIHPELKTIIEQNMNQKSAGYRAQGRKIIGRIMKDKPIEK
jgi:hypothetical protein